MHAHSYTESTVLVILVYTGSQEIACDVVERIRKLIDISCVTEQVEDDQERQDYEKEKQVGA